MGIVQEFSDATIVETTNAFRKRVEAATVFMFSALGESLVKYARERHNYKDRTGNLTNSIGYVVVNKRKVVSKGGFGNGSGANNGYSIALKLASDTPQDYSLIVVAGMNYAAYVEAKGYNVILPAELKAMNDFPETIKRLTKMAKSEASRIYGVY